MGIKKGNKSKAERKVLLVVLGAIVFISFISTILYLGVLRRQELRAKAAESSNNYFVKLSTDNSGTSYAYGTKKIGKKIFTVGHYASKKELKNDGIVSEFDLSGRFLSGNRISYNDTTFALFVSV